MGLPWSDTGLDHRVRDLPRDDCHGCGLPADKPIVDEFGQVWCSDECADFASEVNDELRRERAYADGLDVRSSRPLDLVLPRLREVQP